jgi:hypothetical protein
MPKGKQGLSLRGYAKHAGVALSYIQRLIKAGKVPSLPDGTLDLRVCDAFRASRTNMQLGEIRRSRRAAREKRRSTDSTGHSTCVGCGENYRVSDARGWGSPDPSKFCTRECCADVRVGLTVSQIKQKVRALA